MQNEEITYKYLEQINSPEDVKVLPREALEELADEIRDYLVKCVSDNGGHLSSNLGVVELSIELHRFFDCPKDHIIWDVGHQSYVHKILTGRRKELQQLRKPEGVSGFTNRFESEYDCFGAGHSSTSLSAALGFANADAMNGSDAFTVAVVGDGAFTGGMIHEALNNCNHNLKLVIILNENEMSISKNVGRFAKNLSKIRSTPGYLKTKVATGTVLKKIPMFGKYLYKGLKNLKKFLKDTLYGSNYFENLGLAYMGPIDGNNFDDLESVFSHVKSLNESVIVHIKTKKGKGYSPAEENPEQYHGLSASAAIQSTETFSTHMGKTLSMMADKDNDICAITAAMSDGTGLNIFRSEHKERFFDVGIAEAHALTFAAGLAAEGKKPVCAVYSTFLQRAYDSIIHDIALQKLPVTICIDRSGLNPSDGATHHGIFDVAFLSHIPNMRIFTPLTYKMLDVCLKSAIDSGDPCAIRYPKDSENERVNQAFYGNITPTEPSLRVDFENSDKLHAVIITAGKIVSEALRAKAILKEIGVNIGIILLEYIKPYDKITQEIVKHLPEKRCKIILLEEEIRSGGMGMNLLDNLYKYEIAKNKSITIMALDDNFAIQNKNEAIYKTANISAEDIVDNIAKGLIEQKMNQQIYK